MYLSGFRNHHQTEAIPGTLPTQQNSPQKCPNGLYAEQISGSSFTQTRENNLHSWMYRILPSVVHEDYQPYSKRIQDSFLPQQPPNPLRWSKLPDPTSNCDFIDGLFHVAGNRVNHTYLYQCNQSMTHRFFSNLDGELLLVPYCGLIRLDTEFGTIDIGPGKIAVVPRGIKFKVTLLESVACGYLCENAGLPFSLPELGFLGANALANPRHFLYPTARYENTTGSIELLCKYQQNFWVAHSNHSPLNVIAWHGNYAPYCYDLALFNTINTVSFDHPDPSIFTVLTSESETPHVANLDFVLFPPRWMVANHTFRPPYFHRNVMSELMGLIQGEYDAKAFGFEVGGLSIHNTMTAHGPDVHSQQQASKIKLEPTYYDNTLAFMFESTHPWLVTEQAFHHETRQVKYSDCWQGFSSALEAHKEA